MKLKTLTTPEEIASSFETFLELRPNLVEAESFTEQVLIQQEEGFKIVAILEGEEVAACIGFRILTMLAWGRLFIDSLITRERSRKKGYGKVLMDYAIQFAKDNNCGQLHLDTAYHRHDAHKLYLNQGFRFNCHHASLKLKDLV